MDALRDFDIEVFRFVHIGLHRAWLDPVFFLITCLGLGWVQGPPLLVVWLLNDARQRGTRTFSARWTQFLNRWGSTAGWLFCAFAATGLTNTAIRLFVSRERPSLLAWSFPQEEVTARSFPSGHTITSFAVAILLLLITRRTPDARWGWIGLGVASLIGFSRIYRGVHWPTDVIGGIALAMLWAGILSLARERRLSKPPGLVAEDRQSSP